MGESRVHREARNRQNLLGTILRLDVDRAAGGKPYAVPPDNPFVDASDGIRPEIWAYGFRNPWRISIDRENGRLYVGDVGAHKFEEITRVKKGGNHGWPTLEGIRCFDPPVNCKREGLEMPLAAFPHDFLRTVIGGYVYRGSDLPFLKGRYVFADFFRGLYSLSPEAEGIAHTAKTLVFRARGSGRGDDAEPKTGLLVRFYRELLTSLYGGGGNELRISSLAEDSRGELYVLGIYGGIYRLAKLN